MSVSHKEEIEAILTEMMDENIADLMEIATLSREGIINKEERTRMLKNLVKSTLESEQRGA